MSASSSRPTTGAWSVCADLAPLSRTVAEVRSLVVTRRRAIAGSGVAWSTSWRRALRPPASTRSARSRTRRLFRADGILDRAAHLAAREDRGRLPILRTVPQLRAVRRHAAARSRTTDVCAPDLRCMPDASSTFAISPSPPDWGRDGAAGLPLRRAPLRNQGQGHVARPDGARRRRQRLVAGLFTTNLAQAAPVLVSKRHLARTGGVARAIVVNSGCANACTGVQGMADAERMAADVAAGLGVQSRARARRVDRRDRRQPARWTRSLPGIRDAVAGAGARQGQRDGPRHHDDGSVSEGVRRLGADRAGIVHGRRHGQGLGHDRAEHGHDARFPHDRRECPPGAAPARAARIRRATPSTPSPSTATARPTTRSSRWPRAPAA